MARTRWLSVAAAKHFNSPFTIHRYTHLDSRLEKIVLLAFEVLFVASAAHQQQQQQGHINRK